MHETSAAAGPAAEGGAALAGGCRWPHTPAPADSRLPQLGRALKAGGREGMLYFVFNSQVNRTLAEGLVAAT